MGELNRDLHHYFEYSSAGVQVEEDGLKTVTFGEYLVDVGAVDRYQLLLALQAQDESPGARLGDCMAALGFMHHRDIEDLHVRFTGIDEVVG